MRRLSWFHLAAVLLGSLVLLFIVAPLGAMILAASPSDLAAAVRDPAVTVSLGLTLAAALAAMAAGAVFGVPLAYLLARRRFRGRSLVLAVVDLPVIIPHAAAGIALVAVIGRKSLLGGIVGGGGLTGTFAGIAVAMAFVSIPFLVNGAREAFAAVPARLEKAARTLGATPARVFFTVSLPLAWRGILTGAALMWGRGISEFGAVIIVAYHPMTASVLMYQRFVDQGLAHGRAVAVLLVLICVAVFAALRFAGRAQEAGRDGDA